ncbi:hypothetical protein [Haloarchaeobius sp. DYHT-AS-18]|uniref:hypothetical protein n=1 Tax=Haloarchaeobius sp. DYHT-AS-18 TaxID=3446117 RepID=UPI003EBDF35E
MAISDGQIAMGILQLVGLSLPVFGILTQTYFRMTENQPTFSIGLVLSTGGLFLLMGAISSAAYLWSLTTSTLITISLQFISMGLLFIGVLLWFIYSSSKEEHRALLNTAKNLQGIVKELIQEMEKRDVETVAELRETDFEVPEDVQDDLTLDELKNVREDAEGLDDDIETIERATSLTKLKEDFISSPREFLTSPDLITFVSLMSIYLLVLTFVPDLLGNPLSFPGAILIGWFGPSIIRRIWD